MTARLTPLLLLAIVLAVGCGDEETTPPAAVEEPTPYLSLSEVESVLERGLAVVRSGSGALVAPEVEPAPVDSVRYSTQAGPEFEILVFATPTAARAGMASARGTDMVEDGGKAQQAANVVAVFPEAPEGALRRASEDLDRLSAACGGATGADARLRELCFSGGAVPPAGGGADREEDAPAGSTVTVGGLRYTPALSRQLNPEITPDEEFVGGRRPGEDRAFFGVFLRVCNEDGPVTTPTERLALVAADGERVEPVGLPRTNPFAYAPRPLSRGRCVPPEGGVADSAAPGALVLFDVPIDFFGERPVALEIGGADGARVLLDL
jgi:hypothetical protein